MVYYGTINTTRLSFVTQLTYSHDDDDDDNEHDNVPCN